VQGGGFVFGRNSSSSSSKSLTLAFKLFLSCRMSFSSIKVNLGLFGSSTSYTTFPFRSGSAVAHSARSWFSLAARPSLRARRAVSLCWSCNVTCSSALSSTRQWSCAWLCRSFLRNSLLEELSASLCPLASSRSALTPLSPVSSSRICSRCFSARACSLCTRSISM